MGQLIKLLKEIEIKPHRIWDFSKYIPNFNAKNIKIGDTIIIPEDDINSKVEYITDITIWYEGGWSSKRRLYTLNNDNKNLNEIEIKPQSPLKIGDKVKIVSYNDSTGKPWIIDGKFYFRNDEDWRLSSIRQFKNKYYYFIDQNSGELQEFEEKELLKRLKNKEIVKI